MTEHRWGPAKGRSPHTHPSPDELGRALLSTSDDCIKLLTLDGRLDYMNEGGMCAMEVDDFCLVEGAYWPDSWPGEGRGKALQAMEAAALGNSSRFQSFCPTAKGTPKWWDVSVATLVNSKGERSRILATSRDITELMGFKEALRESEENYRFAIELNPQISWTADSRGELIHISCRWSDVTGSSADDARGRGWLAVVHPADVASIYKVWLQSAETAEPIDMRYRIRQRDGSYRWFRARAAARMDNTGNIARWYGISEDVHDLELAQRDLLRMSRLTAMGAMASTLAHELNQPLAASSNYLALAGKLLQDGRAAEAIQPVTKAKEQALRAGKIIQHIRGFTMQGQVTRTSVRLPELVDDALMVSLSPAQRLSVRVETNIDADAVVIHGDGLQMEQVLTNIFRNAVEAMKETVAPRLSITASRISSGELEIRIRDNGPGLTSERFDSLFKPFARSDKPHGLGLGMSLCRTIVEAHGGSIFAEPPSSDGATFVMRLPDRQSHQVAA